LTTISIVDKERESVDRLTQGLRAKGYSVRTFSTGAEALAALKREPGHLVVCELELPDVSGIELLREVRRADAGVPVIIMTRHTSTQHAIDSMREGAYDYIPKPVETERLLRVIEKLAEGAGKTHALRPEEPTGIAAGGRHRMIGHSPEIIEIYKMIGQVAQSDAAVLIQGESGTGKELVASAVHENSLRRGQPFLPVNCAAIPETLLESELFGYERGAFTGASQTKIGKFEQCHGGTIFLDEIGDMSLSTQAKVLRVLQEQKFERVGGRETLKVNTRVIAATNKSLVECIKEGSFRVDLFYRLKVVSIYLPPLRERGDDMFLLAEYFIEKFNDAMGKRVRGVSTEAADIMRRYSWPGNVRELENNIQTAVLLNKTGILAPADFPFATEAEIASRARDMSGAEGRAAALRRLIVGDFDELLRTHRGRIYEQVVEDVERALLSVVLERVHDNQVRAARLLGISRNTLRSRIERFYRYERRERGNDAAV
jgi:DNA-binding NtrC family response regulator